MTRAERGKALFLSGSNCAQAVFAAFCDKTGFSEEAALRLASSFGGGMGRMREVCGACSGMFLVLSVLYGYSAPDRAAQTALYTRVQALAECFREKNGSIVCRELLGVAKTTPVPSERTRTFYKKRPCASIVEDTVSLLEAYLAEHPPEEA